MKRLLSVILSLSLLLALTGCLAEEISLFYDETAEKDGFTIAINETANCCFVGGFNCKEYNDNEEIVIPDEYEGKPITQIGGYYGRGVPTPFYISVWDIYVNVPEDSEYHTLYSSDIRNFDINADYTVQDIVFTLSLGKNIKSIKNVYMVHYYPHINEDNSITFYHPVVKINCSEDNKYFYSKDGKLYDKNTNALIEDFAYAN